MEKQTTPPEKEITKDKPSSSGEQNEIAWHDGPPHWRRRTDPEAPPRYEDYSQDIPEMHNTYPKQQDPCRHPQPYNETQYYGEVQYQHQQFFPVLPLHPYQFPPQPTYPEQMPSWNQYQPPHHSANFPYSIPTNPYSTQHISYYPTNPPFNPNVHHNLSTLPPIAPQRPRFLHPIQHLHSTTLLLPFTITLTDTMITRIGIYLIEAMGVLTMTMTATNLTEVTCIMIMTAMPNSINPLLKHQRWIFLDLMVLTQKNGFA
jgi:hypothetical protein